VYGIGVCCALAVCRWYSQDYESFYIESEAASFYTLRMSPVSTGDAGDAINSVYLNGVASSNNNPFTSKDADHDKNPGNCAVMMGGGWWHNSCGSGRLMGSPTTSTPGYYWRELNAVQGQDGTLSISYMMAMAI
jgi:Fibrinogen beta and gamma chains, C-terminal globular domain